MKFILPLILILILCSCGNSQDPITPVTILKKDTTSSYQEISFKTLNGYKILKKMKASQFDVDAVEETPQEKIDFVYKQVPEDIKKLNGLNIEIKGYAFPMNLVKGGATEIVLMSVIPSCCFGDNLKLNDIIYVETATNNLKIKENQFLRIKGKLTVEMKQTEDKSMDFLYWLSADEIELSKPGK